MGERVRTKMSSFLLGFLFFGFGGQHLPGFCEWMDGVVLGEVMGTSG